MIKLRTLLAVAALNIGMSAAHATLIDNGGTVLDSESNLEWLDLSATVGKSVNQALSTYGGDGWELATEAQFEGMFDSMFGGFYSETISSGYMNTSLTTDQKTAVDDYNLIFGSTYQASDGGSASYGLYSVGLDDVRMGGVYNTSSTTHNDSLYRDYANDYGAYTTSYYYTGIYLVKSVASVPEPSAIALMGLGLLGLVATRRKKQS